MPEPAAEAADVLGSLSFSPPPMKKSETRDSISSIDSDVSLSFDRKPDAGGAAGAPGGAAAEEAAHLADLSDSASDNGGKDSGCEVSNESSEPPLELPDEELVEKIVAQVEFYFSDANITKDAFLLKHVKRNKEGYVSLKLVSSFKRVKHLTKDWRVVAHALAKSTKLEINELGTKLRRLEPLPPFDQTAPSRTVVAVNMPVEKPTIEAVAELFGTCGEIALVRILRPGNPVPADVRQFINKNPSLNGLVCALVEFVDSESARMAIKMDQNDMKVYELNGVPNPERKKKLGSKKPGSKSSRLSETSDYNTSSCQSSSEAEDYRFRLDPRLRMRRGSSAYYPSRLAEPAAWLQRRLSASSTEAGFLYMPRRLSASSRDSSESSLFLPRRFSNCSLGYESPPPACYPCHRRMSACSQASDCSSARSRSNSAAFHVPENIVRMPQGPDGSRGFRPRYGQIMH